MMKKLVKRVVMSESVSQVMDFDLNDSETDGKTQRHLVSHGAQLNDWLLVCFSLESESHTSSRLHSSANMPNRVT